MRVAAAALAEAGIEVADDRPPAAAELRGAFDTILDHEFSVALGPLLADADGEVMPYIAEQAAAIGSFEPSFDACRHSRFP